MVKKVTFIKILDDWTIIKRIPGTIYFQVIGIINEDGQIVEEVDSVAYDEFGEYLGEFRPFGEIGPKLSWDRFNYWRQTGII